MRENLSFFAKNLVSFALNSSSIPIIPYKEFISFSTISSTFSPSTSFITVSFLIDLKLSSLSFISFGKVSLLANFSNKRYIIASSEPILFSICKIFLA